jgi:uncharacterized protein (TIGR02246 family)
VTLTADDHVAIQQLYARYATSLDLHDLDTWITTWTPDAEFVGFKRGFTTGHEALRAMAEEAIADPGEQGYHWNSNVAVEPTDYGASAICYIMHVLADQGMATARYALHYRDELVKHDGAWRFRRRQVFTLESDERRPPA